MEEIFWSRLQVEVWTSSRNDEAVQLAAHPPGSIRLADLSLRPEYKEDGRITFIDDEECEDDDDFPVFATEADLIRTLINLGHVRSFEDFEHARRVVAVAEADGRLVGYPDPNSPRDPFFDRENVLKLWFEKRFAECSEAQPLGDVPPPSEERSLPSHAELVAFLLSYADGTKPESECRKASEERFRMTMPDSEKVWRPAWREIPKDKKLARGRRPRRSKPS
jgi:hypothetical protein